MALSASDVQSPTGDIDGAIWFPSVVGGALTTLLNGYITDAADRTDDESAQRLWVYYRAASAVADRLATTASSKTMALVDQGSKSESFSAGQFKYWADKAAAYLAAFEAAIEEDGTEDVRGWSVLTSLRHA